MCEPYQQSLQVWSTQCSEMLWTWLRAWWRTPLPMEFWLMRARRDMAAQMGSDWDALAVEGWIGYEATKVVRQMPNMCRCVVPLQQHESPCWHPRTRCTLEISVEDLKPIKVKGFLDHTKAFKHLLERCWLHSEIAANKFKTFARCLVSAGTPTIHWHFRESSSTILWHYYLPSICTLCQIPDQSVSGTCASVSRKVVRSSTVLRQSPSGEDFQAPHGTLQSTCRWGLGYIGRDGKLMKIACNDIDVMCMYDILWFL